MNLKTLLSIIAVLLINTAIYAQTFDEVASDIGLSHAYNSGGNGMGGGLMFFDYNNDGWMDLYACGGTETDRLFRNLGDGSFEDVTAGADIDSTLTRITTGVSNADFDRDGDQDIFVSTWFSSDLLFRNNGDGTFTEISEESGIHAFSRGLSSTWGDYNLDGWIDLYVGSYFANAELVYDSTATLLDYIYYGHPNLFYINNGDGTFTESSSLYQLDNEGCALAVAFTDYDCDEDPDILVANDFGMYCVPNTLYENHYPADEFIDASSNSNMEAEMYGMGIAKADYDEDGDLDYYVTNIGRNALFQNQGDGSFEDVTEQAGVENTFMFDSLYTTGWGTAFFDYDNDSYLDLAVANGYIHIGPVNTLIPHKTSQIDPSKLYRNNGDGTFEDVSEAAGILDSNFVCRGLAYADYDQDGDVDWAMIAIPYYSTDDNPRLLFYRNELENEHNWLQVQLTGIQSNTDAFGAKVKLIVSDRTFVQEVDGGSSHASQNSPVLHFGLGDLTAVDSLIIQWPGGGEQSLSDVSINQLIQIEKDTLSTGLETLAKDSFKYRLYPNYLHVNTDAASLQNAELEFYQINGQLIERAKLINGHLRLRTQNLLSGIYFVQLRQRNSTFAHTQKIWLE